MSIETSTIRVIAHLVSQTEKSEELKLILTELVAPVRLQSGCLQYELLQSDVEPTDFVFVEEWESKALLEAHLASQIIQVAGNKMRSLLASPVEIRLYRLLA